MEGGTNGGPIEAVDNMVYLSVMTDARQREFGATGTTSPSSKLKTREGVNLV
jgi:hypothetical protein